MDRYRDIAHEIRTPLAVIRTSTEVALMDPNLSKSTRETLEQTLGQLDRISETMNTLLAGRKTE
ncbi:MAG: Two-component system, OmpR family, sensor histidine kinase CiaH [Parcubacteria group bacterium]|nr:Two-component system, OmpR family, sensor histidine kinase CiaH [Parcubacteria group bacterium]